VAYSVPQSVRLLSILYWSKLLGKMILYKVYRNLDSFVIINLAAPKEEKQPQAI